MQQIKLLPTALEQNLQLLNTLAKPLEHTSITETQKEKTSPFTEHLMQHLRTIRRLNGALRGTYLCYLEAQLIGKLPYNNQLLAQLPKRSFSPYLPLPLKLSNGKDSLRQSALT